MIADKLVCRRTRVLYIHQDGRITGSAISLRNLLSGLDRERFEPHVLLASEGPVRKLYEELRIPVDVVPIRAHWTFPGPGYFERAMIHNLGFLLPNPRLAQYIRELDPDIVHINDKAMLSAGMTVNAVGKPIVWHLRSSYNITKARLSALLSRTIIKRCAHQLIAISEDETDGFEDADNLNIIYNTVDLDAANQALEKREETRSDLCISRDEFVVGLIGALNERKGAWDFIKAAGIVKKQNPHINYRFVILAGIPPRKIRSGGIRGRLGLVDMTHPEDRAWQVAESAGVRDVLTLTGFRHDPLNVIAAFDIAVVANRLGVLGRPPFEAMSVGRPLVVTSGHTGKSTIVQPDKTALVVPPADIQALADAVCRLSDNYDLRRSFQENSTSYVHLNFDPKKNTPKIAAIYDRMLNNAQTAGK